MSERDKLLGFLTNDRQPAAANKEGVFDLERSRIGNDVMMIIEKLLFQSQKVHGGKPGRLLISIGESSAGYKVYLSVNPSLHISKPLELASQASPMVLQSEPMRESIPFDQEGYIAGIDKLAMSDSITADLMRGAIAKVKARKAAAKKKH